MTPARSPLPVRSRASKSPPLSSNRNPSSCLSASSNYSPASDDSSSRCEGLDLLVLAAIEVFGDRVFEEEHAGRGGDGEAGAKQERKEVREEGLGGGVAEGLKRKGNRRESTMPSRFRDSVLQPWKRSTGRRRRLSAGKRLDSGEGRFDH